MRERINLSGVEVEVMENSGTFTISICKDFSGKDTGMWEVISMELTLDYSDFEKLLNLLKEAWESWEAELNILKGDEL